MEEAEMLIKNLKTLIRDSKNKEDEYLEKKHSTKNREESLIWDTWVSYHQGRKMMAEEILKMVQENFKTACIECGETVTVKETLNGICTKCMANGLMGP